MFTLIFERFRLHDMRTKISYLLNAVGNKITRKQSFCPYCKSRLAGCRVVDRKFLVTTLVECGSCNLLVRVPTDDVNESNKFYDGEYSQGYTTDCPSENELQRLVQGNFVGSERDYSRYLRFFEFLGISKPCRVLDFGCSWGYGAYQMQSAGYTVEGYEPSIPRANYGRDRLGVTIRSREEELVGGFDIIFSSHVLEHLPDFAFINRLYGQQLNRGGYFIAITPNGSNDFSEADYSAYHQLWGKVHPVLLSDRFVNKNFGDEVVYLDSWQSMQPEMNRDRNSLQNWELVFVLKKP